MITRREFIVTAAGVGLSASLGLPAFAQLASGSLHLLNSYALTQVFGDGARIVGIALQFDQPIANKHVTITDFTVDDRRITQVFTATSADPATKSLAGPYIIITLDADDQRAGLTKTTDSSQSATPRDPSQTNQHGPGKAGDKPGDMIRFLPAKITYTQRADLQAESGAQLSASQTPQTTTASKNRIVDQFTQHEFYDEQTGRRLKYNLFIPTHAQQQSNPPLPLVLFMHDAGATSEDPLTTLLQGLGAVCWASPDDQAQRPCVVLAPQFDEIVADDDSHTSNMLDTTIHLINKLCEQYPIDRNRLYATGQSGGCMLSIAMNIAYPTLFAASFLVAGQWSAALTDSLAQQTLFILVSEDDDKASAGQNAITAAIEQSGTPVAKAIWDARWNDAQFDAAFSSLADAHASVNYVKFAAGTVIPPGQQGKAASGHVNTWRVAYAIEPIRRWLFQQQKRHDI